ncbi:MAG: hypothetical protein JXQ75_14290 [Phycisphaerae bacterium]|nr:hypothetical protein [Phycisphaerae bacterium]
MVIVIASLEPDTGKSTIAVHMAAWLHEQMRSVAFVDADSAQRGGSAWVRLACPGIPVHPITGPVDALDLIPQIEAEHCVVDAPSGDPVLNWSLMMVAEIVIVPCGAGRDDPSQLQKTVRALSRVRGVRQGNPSALLVMNQVRARDLSATETLFAVRELGLPVATTSLSLRMPYAKARSEGSVVWRMPGDASDAAEEMRSLFAEALNEGRDVSRPDHTSFDLEAGDLIPRLDDAHLSDHICEIGGVIR